MPKSNSCNNGWLNLLFNNVAFANIGNSGGLQPSGAAGSLYFSLHNASPGVAGSQTTNETAYTSYARVAVARSSGGFTISGNAATLTSLISFPTCTGTGDTINYFGIGTASTGTGVLLYYGAITTTIPTSFTGLSATSVLTIPGLSLNVGNQISFYAPLGSTLPGGITQDIVYFIKTVSGDQYTISATNGGSQITITADGEGVATQVTPLVVTASPAVTPQLTTALSVSEQ